jgi:hypothetical protein
LPTAYATRRTGSSPPPTHATVTWPRRDRDVARRKAPNVARSRMLQTTRVRLPSGRQTMPALEAAGAKNRTAGTGGHPVPKAVVLSPFTGIGLVSSLHFLSSSLEIGNGGTPGRVGRPHVLCVNRPECLVNHVRRVPVI